MNRIRGISLGLVALCLVGTVTNARAEDYPDRPVKMIAAFPPGGTSDYIARMLAQAGTQVFGKSVVVENKAGAGGMIGLDYLSKTKPDGYTVGIASGALAIYPSINKSMPFDPTTDFDYYGLIGRAPSVLLVTNSHPAKTFEEFVAYAKSHPGQPYGSAGSGTNTQFTGELINLAAGIEMKHVPYRGGAPQLADLMAGTIPIAVAGITTAMPFIKSGMMRAIAVSTAERSKSLPDVPTLREKGLTEIDTAEWFALVAPRGTPDQVGNLWNSVIAKMVADPSLTEKNPGLETKTSTRDELKQLVAKEVELWKGIAKRANIEQQ